MGRPQRRPDEDAAHQMSSRPRPAAAPPDALHSSQQQPAALPAPTGAARPMSTPRPREVL